MPTQDHQAKITPLLRDTEPFLGCEKYQPVRDSIYQGLCIIGGYSGVMPELHIQPGSGTLADVIPGWKPLGGSTPTSG